MEPKDYEARARYKSLPLDFQYQDADKYESNYEYIKDNFSSYHFDKWKKEEEGEWWHQLGRFELDPSIDEMLPWLIEKSKEVGWNDLSKIGAHPGFPGGISPLHSQEEHDRLASGVVTDFVQMVPEPDMVHIPALQKMGEYWKFKRLRTRVHVQFPGQLFSTHVDKLWHRNPLAPHKMCRMVIFLQDYEPGQVMVYGNSVLTQWRKGDVHIFDTLNIPHSTANMSYSPRAVMIITAARTDESDEILRACNKDSIHRITL
jgi:hypothetical protein